MAKAKNQRLLPMLIIVSLIVLCSSIAIWLVNFNPDIQRQSLLVNQSANAENVSVPLTSVHDKPDEASLYKEQESILGNLAWQTRPKWQLDGLLVDQLSTLQKTYQRGDNAAGFVLAAYLSRCSKAPSSEKELEEKVNAAIDTDEQNLAEQMMRRYYFCDGVSEELRSQHLERFIALAKDGFTPALEVMGSLPSKQYMQYMQLQDLPRDAFIAARDAFEKSKYAYLNQAAEQGSMLALLKLSSLNSHPPALIQEKRNDGHTSLSLALAYATVVKHFTQDDVVYGRAEFTQNRLYQQATAAELHLAATLSENMISKIELGGQAYSARESERWVFTFY
jgi:hypothetical protein